MEVWKLYIIEIEIQFGKQNQKEEESNILKRLTTFKKQKYEDLIRNLKSQFEKMKSDKIKF
jgi:hypothetical protein